MGLKVAKVKTYNVFVYLNVKVSQKLHMYGEQVLHSVTERAEHI